MIKQIAWNTFKNTGNINTFLELKQIQNLEQLHGLEKIGAKVEKNEFSKDTWNNYSRV